MLRRPILDDRHFGLVHNAVSCTWPELTMLVDTYQSPLDAWKKRYFIAPQQCRTKTHELQTNTAEKADAGTVDQCLDSSGFLLYTK